LAENNLGTMYSAYTSVAGKARLMNIGMKYKFSKRTNMFAYYASMDNTTNSSFVTTLKVGTANIDPSMFAIGLRHSF